MSATRSRAAGSARAVDDAIARARAKADARRAALTPEQLAQEAQAREAIALLSTRAGDGVRSSLRLQAIGRRAAARTKGLWVEELEALELEAELDARRRARGLPPLAIAKSSDTGKGAPSADLPASILPPVGGDPAPLESIGITDPEKGDRAVFLTDADPYMRDVEAETAGYRQARALRLRRRAREILALTRAEELPPELLEDCPELGPGLVPLSASADIYDAVTAIEERRNRARWYTSRATGSLERFPRVRDCGEAKITATCARSCGVERCSPAHCAVGRLCVACRARAAKDRKERFDDARAFVMHALKRSGLRSRKRGYNQWRERFLTLTVPHVDAGAVEGGREACESKGIGDVAVAVAVRVRLLLQAWRAFSLQLQRWARAQSNACFRRAKVAWYRAFEWTPGDDGLGHPHFHLWIVCPFLDRELVREWWAEALEGAGLPGVTPIVDVRGWKMPSADIARELLKGERSIKTTDTSIRSKAPSEGTIVAYVEGWSIVDTVNGTRIAPEVSARLYEALDGHRLVQTSRDLLDPVTHECPFCGATGATDVRIAKPTARELAAAARVVATN